MVNNVLYVDETPFNLQAEKGYVWVFTNNNEVIYIYKPNREGLFLHKFLKRFKGILVSDFYAAYDSLDNPQQKCLIHLIRSLNSDLATHPFNPELSKIAKRFTMLLKSVVDTIDKKGLKKYYLKKHCKSVEIFLSFIQNNQFETEIADSTIFENI